MVELHSLFQSRKEELFFYSPYSFLRKVSPDNLFVNTVKAPLLRKISDNAIQIITINAGEKPFLFLVEHLQWDSDYFGFPIYKLHTVLFYLGDQSYLGDAFAIFITSFFNVEGKYCFADIPSEDILLLQAFTGAGFKLIETRMTYFLDLKTHHHERFQVREAQKEDIPNLRRVASEMRNPFDRFHADPAFEPVKADEFLATFIEESVKGFADYTMVPNETGIPPDAFLTAKFLKDDWPVIDAKVSKMVLSAVSSKTCKGWYKKLISEMAYYLQSQGAEYAFMHPASTNKAVIYTYETLGCRLGQVSHIFSLSETGKKS